MFVDVLLVVVLALAAAAIVNSQKVYGSLPIKELKRRARTQKQYKTIYGAMAYSPEINGFLWLAGGLLAGGFYLALGKLDIPVWIALMIAAAYTWSLFIWLPRKPGGRLSLKLAVICSPFMLKIYRWLHPVTSRLWHLARRSKVANNHTRIYEKSDMLELLDRQAQQADNRVSAFELELAKNSLRFSSQKIGNSMVPRRAVKMVRLGEPVGPVLLDELHSSGHSRFPAYEDSPDEIAGVLYLRDLISSSSHKTVRDAYKKEVHFIHEEESLYDGLQAIIKTHQQLFVVVNSFEEYVGIITIEDILEQLIGVPIVDEFDQYDDVRAVAARQAAKEHKEHETKKATP